jgi:hypothetical protein
MQQAPGMVEKDRTIASLEQFHPQCLFQRADLTTHGTMGDMQLFGSLDETLRLRGSIEKAKRGEGRKAHTGNEISQVSMTINRFFQPTQNSMMAFVAEDFGNLPNKMEEIHGQYS